jgi:nitrate reductase cytochrome c-type subunit
MSFRSASQQQAAVDAARLENAKREFLSEVRQVQQPPALPHPMRGQ